MMREAGLNKRTRSEAVSVLLYLTKAMKVSKACFRSKVAFSSIFPILLLADYASGALLFDNMTSVAPNSLANVTSTPNTFMGDAFVLAPGANDLTGLDLFPYLGSGTSYVGLKLNFYIWGNVNTGSVTASAPAFSDLIGSYSLTFHRSYPSGYYYNFESATPGVTPGIPLPSPLLLPSTVSTVDNSNGTVSDLIGITFNFQGTTDGTNFNSANGLTPIISPNLPTTGANYFNGYYRNANSEMNGNFTSSIRSLGLPNQNIGIRIYGDINSGAPSSEQWNSPHNGDWNSAANWTPDTIPSTATDAIFNQGSPSAYTVTVSQANTAKDVFVQSDNLVLDLNTAASSLSIGGALTVGVPAVSGSAITGTLSLTHSFAGPSANFSAGSAVIGGNGGSGVLTIGPGVNLMIAGTTTIGAASTLTVSPGGRLYTSMLSLAGTTGAWTGTLDLGTGQLDLAGNTLAMINNQVAQGYAGGTWQGGGGILSTAAASDSAHLTAIGVVSNNVSSSALYGVSAAKGSFGGLSPGLNDVLVKYTYYGDANLDGKVDGSDYSLVDNTFLDEEFVNGVATNPISGWFNGDFNYDGVVDGSDYTLMDNAFNQQGNAAVNPDAQIRSVPVPEPVLPILLTFIAIGSRRRRDCFLQKAATAAW